MKIGIFTDCYYPQVNGVVTSVVMLEEELVKLGHDVTIVTVKVPNHIDKKSNIVRIKSIPFAKWNEFRLGLPFVAEAYHKIKALNLDLIHTHTEFSVGLLGRFAARNLDIPIVHTYHTMYEDYTHYISRNKYGKKVVKKIIIRSSKNYVKHYDGIIAPTDKTRFALRSYGVENDIYVVPTGIDLRLFERFPKDHPSITALYDRYNLTKNDRFLLSLGRLSEEKSIDLIIKEMPNLLKVMDDLKLIIVGDGPYRGKLEKLSHELHLEDHVLFIGKVPHQDVTLFYSIADVFISASKTETQGLTIMEAMATGIPVVVYDDLNVTDLVIESVSGRLFKTPEQLTLQVIDSIKNTAKTAHLAERATLIVNELSKESYAKNAEKVYYQLVNSNLMFNHMKTNA